jgi:hypothetical protein
VVANYIHSFTTLATSKLSNSLRSATTTTEYDDNDDYTPTWKEWYASLVGGGEIKYTRGSTLRTCVDDLPIPGVATGAFSQPSKYWSAQSIVQFDGAQDGTPYADGLPRLVDLRASCCKSQITWPKCWADDTAPTTKVLQKSKTMSNNVLRSIHANSNSLKSRGFIKASLDNGKLSLECVHPSTAFYADSVGPFVWKLFPSKSEWIQMKSSAVLVRCQCKRNDLFQYLRESIQLRLKGPFPIPNMRGFQEKYELEQHQCIESDLVLTQIVEKTAVRRRLERI